MVNEEIILQIFFVSIGMVFFSMLLNLILGIRPEKMKLFREKLFNLQERIKQAQVIGDPQLMQSLQFESMQMMKEMMKKQLLPMCIRCFIFIGILVLLNFIYADYVTGLLPFPILFFGDGWFAVYFLFAIGLSLSIYGIKKLYFKITGKESKRKRMAREMSGMQMPGQGGLGGMFQLPGTYHAPIRTQIPPPKLENRETSKNIEKSDSWKERIQNKDEE